MSPEHAKIFFVEENPDVQALCETALTKHGHTIVETVRTQGDAMEKITDLGRLNVQVALIDGYTQSTDLDDSRIAAAIRAKYPTIKLIGFISGHPFPEADAFVSRSNVDHLCEVVKAI